MTTQNPQAAVVMQEDAYCDNANMFFVQIPEVTDDKLYAMAAIINSTPFAYFAKSIANPQQGGFYKFNKQFLDPVPFHAWSLPHSVSRCSNLQEWHDILKKPTRQSQPAFLPLLAYIRY